MRKMRKNFKRLLTIMILVALVSILIISLKAQAAISPDVITPEIHIVFNDEQGNRINGNFSLIHTNVVGQISSDTGESEETINYTNDQKEYSAENGEVVIESQISKKYGTIYVNTYSNNYVTPVFQFKYDINQNTNTVTTSEHRDINRSNITTEFVEGKVYIYIKLVKNFTTAKVEIKNDLGMGKVANVIVNNESESRGVSAKDLVRFFNLSGKYVTGIKDLNENSVGIDSSEIIGTGAKITTEEDQYTVIVYGDATGDGYINAADISVVINYFLGNNTDLSNVLFKAGDVYYDGNLNAGDISLMIDSFLGDLDDSIYIQAQDVSF